MMLAVNLDQRPQVVDKMNPFTTYPIAVEVQPDRKLYKFLADLSPDTPWGDRQIAAKKLGSMRCQLILFGWCAVPSFKHWR